MADVIKGINGRVEMNGTCYLCRRMGELSSEHIIPQCLGGVVSERLYCARCNSTSGHEIDAELAKQFGRYATLLGIRRERGRNQPTSVVCEDSGLRLTFDGKTLARETPVVRIDKDDAGRVLAFEIAGRSREECESILGGICRKYSIDPALAKSERIEQPAQEVSDEIVIDNQAIRRAIAKIAYGFASSRLPAKLILAESFSPIRDFVLGKAEVSLASPNFVHGEFMLDNTRPLHKVHISLNRRDRLVAGYVALFGTFRYTVLLSGSLNSEVEWPAIDYTYDPVSQRDVPMNLNFRAPHLNRDQVLHPKQSCQQVGDALQRGMDMMQGYIAGLEEVSIEMVGSKGK